MTAHHDHPHRDLAIFDQSGISCHNSESYPEDGHRKLGHLRERTSKSATRGQIGEDGQAVGYVRCSTQEQADSGLGLAAQTERIRAYCTLKALNLLDIITDAGVTGGKPLADRDGGRKLLDTIRTRKADAVIMLKLDRMFRNAGDCLTTVEAWERSGVALHVVDLGGNAIDTTSAAGRFMLVVLAGAAEMERNLIRERTRTALAVKRGNGERTGSVPYGYDLAGDSVTLIPNPDEQTVIAEVRALRDRGWSFPRIAEQLTAQHVPTKRGNGHWNQSTIRGLLRRADQVARASCP